MRIITNTKKQPVSVGSDFLRLLSNSDESSTVSITYTIDRKSALNSGVSRVRVSAYTEQVTSPKITEFSTTQELIDNILTSQQDVRLANSKNRESAIFSYFSDVTKSVDNSEIRAIASGAVKKVSSRVVATPISKTVNRVFATNVAADESRAIRSMQTQALTLLLVESVDPSEVTHSGRVLISPADLMAGVFRSSDRKSDLGDYARSLLSSGVSHSSGLAYEHVTDESVNVTITDIVKMPPIDGFSEVTFSFEALGPRDTPIGKVTKSIKTDRIVAIFRTPTLPPAVAAIQSSTGTCTLQITQKDPIAESVAVYKRSVSHAEPVYDSAWERVTQLPLRASDGTITFPLDTDIGSTTVVRVVPLGKYDVAGAEFSSAVIPASTEMYKSLGVDQKGSSHRRLSHVSLVASVVSSGIMIEVSSLPYDAMAVRILRRSPTSTQESRFSVLTSFQVDPTRKSYTYTDSDVLKRFTYEYSCQVVYEDGTIDRQGSSFAEFIPSSNGLVDTRVSDVTVTDANGNRDVSFVATTKVVPTTLDAVKAVLKSQNMEQYFSADILKERDALQGLIVHSVDRVDLTDGTRESFGVIPDGTFVDSHAGPINAVRPLHVGHSYRYEVKALIRYPETVLEKYAKPAESAITKRKYTFSPAKFRHPLVLTEGNIHTPTSITANHAKEQFSFGDVGSVAVVDVTMVSQQPTISVASAMLASADVVEVSWKMEGDQTWVDHFIVIRSSLGGREIVGKSHVFQPVPEFRFLDRLSKNDVGEVSYSIISIGLDFAKLQEVQTNVVALG